MASHTNIEVAYPFRGNFYSINRLAHTTKAYGIEANSSSWATGAHGYIGARRDDHNSNLLFAIDMQPTATKTRGSGVAIAIF